MADIYLSSTDRGRVYKLPFLPEAMPEITRAANNQEFETYSDGTYNILSAPGLREFSLEGLLPGKRYSFAKSAVMGRTVIGLMDEAMTRKKPLRLIISGGQQMNCLVSVESLTWNEDQVGDIAYSVTFKEYRNV